MKLTVTDLKIDGVTMPTLLEGGLILTSEKLWSEDTGRTASGRMEGTILAIHKKGQLKWPPLTMEETAIIENAVSNIKKPFCTVEYTDMRGKRQSIAAYFGTPTYTINDYDSQQIDDVSVDFIER